ncbi:diguanylate cyclase [Metallumcola ferriviriculae]|uniref:Diguanylate cyclase n=1 Tax=Metallumcola ferriviriculae TaxID=3039180 RepID=A0AAU0UKB3_9FIRM|nr:diguanylate cyclase [Desulfitibacteraceae bacterium MK1]
MRLVRRKKAYFAMQACVILSLAFFGLGVYSLSKGKGTLLLLLSALFFVSFEIILVKYTRVRVLRNRLLKLQREELAQRVNELSVLYKVSELDYSANDLDSFLQSLLEHTCNVFHAPAGELLLLEGDELKYRAWRGLTDAYVQKVHFRIGEGLIGRSALGEVIRADDLHSHPQALFVEENLQEGFSSFLSVPLRVKDKIIGVLAIRAREVRTFGDVDTQLLATIANNAASFIDQSRLYYLLKETNKELELVNKVSRVLNSSLHTDKIFKNLLDEIVAATGLRRCTLFSVDYDNGVIVPEVSTFLSEGTMEKWNMPIDGSLTGKAVRKGKALIISDMSAEVLSAQGKENVTELNIKNLAIIPIIYRGRVNGVIHLNDRDSHEFRKWEIELVEAAADHAGVALENARLYQRMAALAVTDGLTGAYTRQYLNTRFEEEWVRCQRENASLSLLMIDIDDFKVVNDKYGHLNGDKVLKQLVKIVKENVRRSDVVSRYGGEEFVIILPDTDRLGALKAAKKIRREVERQTTPQVTVSVGIAENTEEYVNSEQLLQEADAAMYGAKKGGKNRVYLASSGKLEVIENCGQKK